VKNTHFRNIFKIFINKKAVSVVISTTLMTSAVMALGFVILFWTQEKAFEANSEYSENTDLNIAKIGEELIIEHIFYDYNENTLKIWLLNCGKTNSIQLTQILLSNSSWSQTCTDFELKYLNGTSTESLNVNEEAVIELSVNLVTYFVNYDIQINTERSRQFVSEFIA